MARGMHFRKLRSEEYTAPSSLCSSVPVSARGLALFTQDISQFRKGLELYYKKCISGNKIRWRLQLVGFHTIRNAHMWTLGKTRIMSTFQAPEKNNNKELTILRLRYLSREEC